MPASSPEQARALYEKQRTIALAAIAATDRALGQTDDLDRLAAVIALWQLAAAQAAASSYDELAGEPLGIVAQAFSGTNAVGLPLQVPLESIFDDARRVTALADPRAVRNRVVRLAVSQVQDAGRGAGQAAIVTHPEWTNYVRVLKPPSCPRCAILAGRIYRDLDHFSRHPQCDCQMWPVESWEQAHDQGLVSSPGAAFDEGQITGLSAADTQAVEDGADIAAVVNAAQGMTRVELFGRDVAATLAGTTKRSAWRRAHPDVQVRLRPETIYAEAKDRDDAIRLLKRYGYITGDGPAGTSTGDSGSGGGRGGGRGAPPQAPGSAPDPKDRDAWRARQDAIQLDFGGDVLEPHEVQTVERLLALGNEIRWIPRKKGTSTNDFAWLSKGGVEVEMKSTQPAWGAIHGRIVDATSRAWRNHGVVKEHFLIDIGDNDLPDDVRDKLADFNLGRRRYRLRRLWVMARGEITEIELRT